MKRQIRTPTVLMLSLLLPLISFSSAAQAQKQGAKPDTGFKADTGIITPGLGQILRITVATGAGGDAVKVRFASVKYMPVAGGCNNDGVCRHVVASSTERAPVTVNGSDAASFDIQGTGAGQRVVVFTSTRDVRVSAEVINPNGESGFYIIVEALP
ncbi:MAG: hypothetical protein QOE77_1617 [Blastocatellia bacterium]|nr:hypothetical protein [Blastocatellia bacterium]